MVDNNAYLGDSVYATFDGYNLTLVTDNGLGATNTIYMEPSVVSALEAFIVRIKDYAALVRREASEAQSYADLTASGGIVDAP